MKESAKLIAAQTQNKVEVLNYVGNLDKVISAIKDSEYVVGARFHSIVSALAFAVPCLPISYSNKTDNLLEDIKFKGISTTIRIFSDMTIDEIDKIVSINMLLMLINRYEIQVNTLSI